MFENDIPHFIERPPSISHIVPDLRNPSFFLFSHGSALKTMVKCVGAVCSKEIAGSYREDGYVEGVGTDARFNQIPNFLQLNKDEIVIVDGENHCLRHIARPSMMTSHYAGDCQTHGFADGEPLQAKFFSPDDILLDERTNKSLIITDDGNNALRSIDIASRNTTTILKFSDRIERPRHATFDNDDKNVLYLTVKFYVLKVFLKEKTWVELFGVNIRKGFQDGPFESAMTSYRAGEIVQLDASHLVYTDFWKREVRIVDLVNQQVSSLCKTTSNGTVVNGIGCQLFFPHAILKYNNSIFVGDNSKIHQFPCKQNSIICINLIKKNFKTKIMFQY